MKRQISSVAMVALILGSMVFMPLGANPIGTASATHDCDNADALVAAVTFTYVNYDKCTNNHVQYVIDELESKDGEQVKLDIYQNALETNAQSNIFGQTIDNYAQDTRSVAQSIGRNAYIRELENGSSEPVARSQAKAEAADYYSVKIVQLLKEWEVQVEAYDYASSTADSESNVGGSFVGFDITINDGGGSASYLGTATQTTTLPNGTSYTYTSANVSYSAGGSTVTEIASAHSSNDFTIAKISNDIDVNSGQIQAPNSNYDNIAVIEWSEAVSRFNKLDSQNSQVQDNIDLFVDNTYEDYQQGTIDSSDLVDPTTLGRDFATSYNETGYYTYAVGSLAMIGQNIPNMNTTGSFIVEYEGNEYEGMLTSQGEPPNGQFEAGTTYNASNIGGSQILITSEGTQFDLEGEFTVKSITSRDGEELDSVETESYNYDSTNISEYQLLNQQLSDLRGDIEQSSPTGPGGGGSSDNEIPAWLTEDYGPIPLWGWISMALAGAYVLQSARGS